MTKYEWESELKKNIHRLPADEQQRVFEYYNELFEDKIESGMSERDVIYAFGNPVDVADKILGEYFEEQPIPVPDNVYRADPRTSEPVPPEKPAPQKPDRPVWQSVPTPQMTAAQKTDVPFSPDKAAHTAAPSGDKKPAVRRKVKIRPVKLVVFVLLCIFLGGPLIAAVASVWAVLVSMVAAFAACVVGGVVVFFPSMYLVVTDFGIGIVQVGICLALVGLSLLGILLSIKLIKVAFKLTKKSAVWTKNFFFTQKEAIYEN